MHNAARFTVRRTPLGAYAVWDTHRDEWMIDDTGQPFTGSEDACRLAAAGLNRRTRL